MERKERRHHTREFKLEAVRLAAVGDKTKAKVARELGVRVNQLRQWRLDFEEEERNGVPKQELGNERNHLPACHSASVNEKFGAQIPFAGAGEDYNNLFSFLPGTFCYLKRSPYSSA